MAHSIFDALSGVSLDGPSVESLLGCQTPISGVEQSDEEDLFQCGKCKSQFSSLHLFIRHKKEHGKVSEQAVDLSLYLESNTNDLIHDNHDCRDDTQFNPGDDYDDAHHLQESIMEDNDILFSMDQDGANYLASDSSFNVPIIMNTDELETFTHTSITEIDDDPIHDSLSGLQFMKHDPFKIEDDLNSDDSQKIVNIEDKTHVKSSISQPEGATKSKRQQNLKYKCSFCQKQFAKKFYWQQHERSHTGEKPYQCMVCGRPFAQKSNVKKHMSSHKVWPGTAIHSLPPEAPIDGSIERSYHCQFCKEIFDSYKALKGHLIVSHLTLKVYKCVQYGCGSMFAELEDFLEHTQSHKRSEYRCHICGEAFNTLTDLGLHQYTHSIKKQKTTEKYYCCSVCKSSFSNLEALQHHTETTTHDYACPHCGKSFLIERFLRRHLKTHASSARFACGDCGKAFKTEQYLANHKLIHSEETPFLCPHCPARFKRKDRLGRHMLIHDLTKRLKCPFRGHLGCMREFSRPDKLKRHLLTHSNIKRFSCTHCSRHFHRAQALKHHELVKHGFKCDVCSSSFKTKDQLVNHSCELAEPKKHPTSQLPKKASGSFKPRRPTPRRQAPSKNMANSATSSSSEKEREKTKVEDLDKESPSDILKVGYREDDFNIKLENIDLGFDLNNDSSLILDTSSI